MPESAHVTKQTVHQELETVRMIFHGLLNSISEKDLKKPTKDTSWNNEELLFHMVFGYMVVLSLIWLVKLMGRLPLPMTKPFASILNYLANPFHGVNYIGSCLAAKVYNHRRMGAKFDRVCAALERRLASEDEQSLNRRMYYPTRWDPFFKEVMTLTDIYHYPTKHFNYHRRQLNL